LTAAAAAASASFPALFPANASFSVFFSAAAGEDASLVYVLDKSPPLLSLLHAVFLLAFCFLLPGPAK
jgi:hypothetical protein